MGILKICGAWLSLLMVSCQGLEEVTPETGLDYQPLMIGNYWEYEVEEVLYFGESDSEKNNFFYRDEIISDYLNEAGDQVFLVQRQKSADQKSWQEKEIYAYRLHRQALVRTMDNRATVPLIFPPVNNLEWDGNIYNASAKDIYKITLHQDYIMGNRTYPSVVSVSQNDEDDLLTLRDNRYEVYVKGVGLVERYYEVLTYCSRPECLGKQVIDSGRFTHLKLLKNG